MSLKPKHARKSEPKYREREEAPTHDDGGGEGDLTSLASLPLRALAPCTNNIMAERLKEALSSAR